MWTEYEMETALSNARRLAVASGTTAQVVQRGAELVAVTRASLGETVIVGNVRAPVLSEPQINAVSQSLSKLLPVRDALDQIVRLTTTGPDGKPWVDVDRRAIINSIADNWVALSQRTDAMARVARRVPPPAVRPERRQIYP